MQHMLNAQTSSQARGGADGPLDYFRAVDIRNELAAGGERTLFGGLTGNAAVWDKIVKAYEKGGLCACMCARAYMLCRTRQQLCLTELAQIQSAKLLTAKGFQDVLANC